jgi:autotransporter-associated beta strand protein
MKTIFLYASLVSLLTAVAQAQNENVIWQTPFPIAGASDVSTLGTYYGSWAPYDGSASSDPVNGVTFQGFSDLPGLSTTGANSGYNSYANPNTPNANYNTLLQYATYNGNGSGDLTVTWNDTPGHTYLIQAWANDGRGNDRSETFTGGANTSDSLVFGNFPGQYIIGTYVADASGSETITLSGANSANGDYPQINLLQIRDITYTYEGTVLGDKPLAYYPLSPGSDPAGASPDWSGNGNNGTASSISPATGASPYITNAANFNGSSSLDDLSQGTNAGVLDFTGPITMEAWAQPSSTSLFGDIVAKGYDSSSYDEIVVRVNGPYGANYYGSSGSVGETGGTQTTNWTYVVLSSDGTNCSLYENGGLVARSADTTGSILFSDDWVIGDGSSAGNGRYFNGNISQVAIYNYGLTAAQVQKHYLIGLYGTTSLASSNSLRWSANNNTGVWDTDTSTNWINLSNSQQTVFNTGDKVLFDDTAGVPTNVTVSGMVAPGSITVNSSANNFALIGSGSISGPGGLVKEGSSILTISNPASFTGSATISGGAVYAGGSSFASVSFVTITNNSTLDFAGGAIGGNKPVTVSGTGLNGEGALYNSGGAQYDQTLDVSLAGNTTFGAASGGNSRWDLGHGSTLAGPYKVTINFPGGYGEWDTVQIATNVGNLELAQGSWGLKGLGNGLGNPASTLTVDSGTTLDIWNSSYGPTDGYNNNMHVLANATFQILTGFDYFNANMTLENGVAFNSFYGVGNNQMMNGTYTLNGIVHFVFGDSYFIFTNVISGPGGFVWDAYNHQIILQAVNTYQGPTVIGGGLTLALSGSGSIANSALIFFGGGNPNNNSLDVSARSDQTLTLASGQTLAGIGAVNGSLVVSPGATLSPAGTNVILGMTEGSSSTGAIYAFSAATLNGTTVIKLDGPGVNDVVDVVGGITYGGTLSLVNISGSPLAAGDSFQIFNAGSYAGSFASITPPSPGYGLAWDTSELNTGVLNVVTQPIINSVTASAGNLVFGGTNGTAFGTYYVLTTTNLTIPLTKWVSLATNSFDGNGNFSVTNAISPGTPQRYYLIEQVP